MVYWFMRKSINFYGETFIKTLGKVKKNEGSFDAGISYLKEFWKSKGINPAMINFADGSGLSPQNYVSARAEVQSLLWSRKQPWFNEFFDGFPTQGNGMKMKSGTMKDTKYEKRVKPGKGNERGSKRAAGTSGNAAHELGSSCGQQVAVVASLSSNACNHSLLCGSRR